MTRAAAVLMYRPSPRGLGGTGETSKLHCGGAGGAAASAVGGGAVVAGVVIARRLSFVVYAKPAGGLRGDNLSERKVTVASGRARNLGDKTERDWETRA